MPWIERHLPWNRTDVRYCDVTGQLLPVRHWVFTADGRDWHVRDPHCEELYHTYVAPRDRALAASGKDGTA